MYRVVYVDEDTILFARISLLSYIPSRGRVGGSRGLLSWT